MSLAATWGDWESNLSSRLARLVYLDEAGTGSRKDEPITTVAAVIARIDRQMPNINAAVRNLRKALPNNRPEDFEFKADKMFSRFRKRGERSVYAPIMRGFLGIMRDNEVTICHCAVNRANFERVSQSGLSAKRFAFVCVRDFCCGMVAGARARRRCVVRCRSVTR